MYQIKISIVLNMFLKRIMKEYKLLKRENTKQLYEYDAEPVDDSSMNIWNLYLYNMNKQDDIITLRIHYPSDYPISPPFVYVLKPQLSCSFVFEGGAICMELLTQKGWSQITTIHTLAMSIRAMFNIGKIEISNNEQTYDYEIARESFKNLKAYHDTNGWENHNLFIKS